MSAKNEVDVKRSRRRRKPNMVEEEDELVPGVTEAKGRATPSRRSLTEKSTKSSNFLMRSVRGVAGYLDDVRGELAKVTWPTREQALELTRIVLIACIASSIVLGAISLLFTEVFRLGLQYPLIMVVIVIFSVGALVYYMYTSNRRTSTY